jgi:hypothetical protein
VPPSNQGWVRLGVGTLGGTGAGSIGQTGMAWHEHPASRTSLTAAIHLEAGAISRFHPLLLVAERARTGGWGLNGRVAVPERAFGVKGLVGVLSWLVVGFRGL